MPSMSWEAVAVAEKKLREGPNETLGCTSCLSSVAKEKLLEALQEALPKMKPPRCHPAETAWKIPGKYENLHDEWGGQM